MIVLDPLYGEIAFEPPISALIARPIVQRLRHVRLSNIDSLDLTGIGHISRYEHVLGTAYLAAQMPFSGRLTQHERLMLVASALLHDWAITAFGHLLEESFRYIGIALDHQNTLYELSTQEDPSQLGGAQRQILCGRQPKLSEWSAKVFGDASDDALHTITESIRGKGRWGKLIAGEIDLDNIDNVYRAAFHMGLTVDRGQPLKLAQAILDCSDGAPVFASSAVDDIQDWLRTRRNVYEHFMLAENDFAGKLMLIYAMVLALKDGEISKGDWTLTDADLINKLRSTNNRDVRDTVERWLVGELWTVSPLFWVSGEHPSFPKLLEISDILSRKLERRCFAYGIADKRQRELKIQLADGSQQLYGQKSNQWLLGVGSSTKRDFTSSDVRTVLSQSQEYFGTPALERAVTSLNRDDQSAHQMWLL